MPHEPADFGPSLGSVRADRGMMFCARIEKPSGSWRIGRAQVFRIIQTRSSKRTGLDLDQLFEFSGFGGGGRRL